MSGIVHIDSKTKSRGVQKLVFEVTQEGQWLSSFMLNVYHSPYLSIINVKINLILSKNSLLELAPLRKI